MRNERSLLEKSASSAERTLCPIEVRIEVRPWCLSGRSGRSRSVMVDGAEACVTVLTVPLLHDLLLVVSARQLEHDVAQGFYYRAEYAHHERRRCVYSSSQYPAHG